MNVRDTLAAVAAATTTATTNHDDMESSTLPGYLDNGTVSQNIIESLTDHDSLIYMSVPVWARNLIRVYICVVAVIGISGNILLTTVLGTRKKRSSTDILVLALAVSDIISLSFSSPYSFLRYSANIWENISSHWLCKLYMYTQYIMFSASLLLVVSIAIDRYLKVFRPHIPNRRSILAAKLSCFGFCCISTLLGIPILLGVRRNNAGRCIREFDSSQLPVIRVIVFAVAFVSVTSIVIIVIAYLKIGIFLRQRAKVGIIPGSNGRENNPRLSPVPCPSNKSNQNTPAAAGNASRGNVIELGIFSVQKPNRASTNVRQIKVRRVAPVDKSSQTNARTSVIMMTLTAIHFLTRVLPTTISLFALRMPILSLNNLEIYMGLTVMLGKAANPILFAASSSEFRRQAKELFFKSSP